MSERLQPSTVALFTGGADRPYALGLAKALTAHGIGLDLIGSDALDSTDFRDLPALRFLNLRGNQAEDASLVSKASRLVLYYLRLLRYTLYSPAKIFHILWNNRLEVLDRTLLMLYYKFCGKRIALTVHNVNERRRDAKDSLLNRLTLTIQYRMADHIFVHTAAMKHELIADFGGCEGTITVIPLGLNDTVPTTALTSSEAKRRLGMPNGGKIILFFGRIAPYKGLDLLIAAFDQLLPGDLDYRLIIAGRPTRGSTEYIHAIQRTLALPRLSQRVIQRLSHIPDADTELYFKAADVLVLPYRDVFQSGVLVLAYSFGLPVIAADVGSFRDDIIEGQTGFLCKRSNPSDLARTISLYFHSPLYATLDDRRADIRQYAQTRYSWDTVSQATTQVYDSLLAS